MEEEKQEKKDWCEEITQQVEKELEQIASEKVSTNNVDYLYRLVDIHKDLANENYWKEKIKMYGNRYSRDFSGEYGRSSYGRRGMKGTGPYSRYRGGRGSGRYRGEDAIDEMAYYYGNYNEDRERYGADEETMESFKYMLKSFKDYYKHLKQEASSQQEVQMLEDVAREISEM